MSNLLAVGPVELLVILFIVGLPILVIYGIVKVIKLAWKD